MSMPIELVVGISVGLLAGVLSGMFGVGGGSVITPVLVLSLGLAQHTAQGVSLVALLLPLGLPAVLAYLRAGVPIDWRLVLTLVPFFLAGAAAGAMAANAISADYLRTLFAVVLVAMAVRLWRRRPPGSLDDSFARPKPGLWRFGPVIGLAGGLVSGLLGVGGAIAVIPLLLRWARLPLRQAQLTTLAMMLPPVGLPAVWVYAESQGGLPWWLLGGVALGFAGGSLGGARIALSLPLWRLTRIFAAFLAIAAVLMLVG